MYWSIWISATTILSHHGVVILSPHEVHRPLFLHLNQCRRVKVDREARREPVKPVAKVGLGAIAKVESKD